MNFTHTIDTSLANKIQNLLSILRTHAPLLISYSGGLDSSLLAVFTREYLGPHALTCILLDGPSFSRRSFHEAVRIAEEYSLPLDIVPHEFLSDPVLTHNPPDRCRICKKKMFTILAEKARKYQSRSIADGAHTSDCTEYRPGIEEMTRHGVIHPFIMADITKEDIRMIAKVKGYSFWNKPSSACLLSRIPYDTAITKEILMMIEKGEEILINHGFLECRVRHHNEIARIEVPPIHMEKILLQKEKIVKEFHEIGFSYTCLDLEGYRSGSFDKVLGNHTKTHPSKS